MTAEILIQSLVSGILIGMIFSLISVGLTLIFGVMDIVNFAHGEFLMLGMYASYWMFKLFNIDPIIGLVVPTALLFLVGVLSYKLIIRRLIDAPMLAQIVATFGLLVFMRNMAQMLWTEDYRRIGETLVTGRIEITGIFIPLPELVAAIGAVVATGALYWFIKYTRTGMALEAVAEDKEAAALMGIDSDRMFTLAWGLGAACVGVAGGLLSTLRPVYPSVGATFGLIAYVVVALGGFGSVTGAAIAGVIIGVVEVVGGVLWEPRYKEVLVFLIYLGVVYMRPQGLLGRR